MRYKTKRNDTTMFVHTHPPVENFHFSHEKRKFWLRKGFSLVRTELFASVVAAFGVSEPQPRVLNEQRRKWKV